MTFWSRAEHFPPILCRLLARERRYGGPLSTLQIAAGSGMHGQPLAGEVRRFGRLSPAEVESITQCTSWEGVKFADMQAFLRGCGIDFCDSKGMRRLEDYLRKTPSFHHLTSSSEWDAYYHPLVKRWRRSYGPITESDAHIWPPLRALLVRLNPLLTVKDYNENTHRN